jgi:RNA polymerase sigma-70 factor (ECF subfamily)
MRATRGTVGSKSTKTPQPSGADAQGHLSLAKDDLSLVKSGAKDDLSLAKAGDAEALDRLLCEARPRLYALALRVLGDTDDAEDAVQDALVKVWKNLPRFEGRSSFTTWLHRIGVNAALDRRRRRTVGPLLEREEQRETAERATSETPERQYAREETGAVVRLAMGRLSVAHSEALRLCDLEGESYAVIAGATRCPLGTVMSRLYHARRNLVRELAEGAAGDGDLEALRAA